MSKMFRDNVSIIHERKIYTLIELIGEVGGVMEVFMYLFALFLNGISEHSFYMKAIKSIFVVKTKESKIFKKKKSISKTNVFKNNKEAKSVIQMFENNKRNGHIDISITLC